MPELVLPDEFLAHIEPEVDPSEYHRLRRRIMRREMCIALSRAGSRPYQGSLDGEDCYAQIKPPDLPRYLPLPLLADLAYACTDVFQLDRLRLPPRDLHLPEGMGDGLRLLLPLLEAYPALQAQTEEGARLRAALSDVARWISVPCPPAAPSEK